MLAVETLFPKTLCQMMTFVHSGDTAATQDELRRQQNPEDDKPASYNRAGSHRCFCHNDPQRKQTNIHSLIPVPIRFETAAIGHLTPASHLLLKTISADELRQVSQCQTPIQVPLKFGAPPPLLSKMMGVLCVVGWHCSYVMVLLLRSCYSGQPPPPPKTMRNIVFNGAVSVFASIKLSHGVLHTTGSKPSFNENLDILATADADCLSVPIEK
ncbi:hypothetical protein PIB30_035850 [Stylosanthes scabra]|uniref:Uncharacterized protein n=1 Tax=Stylosanthes scabra TaxID=79078 RepID=A0ABU6QDW2_9FABA|nr:hypothetical protein [Stylosanthes scabra]